MDVLDLELAQLLSGVAQHLGHGPVAHEQLLRVDVGNQNTLAGMIEDGAKPLFGVAQRLFGPFVLGAQTLGMDAKGEVIG